jgi:hypothetical protein
VRIFISWSGEPSKSIARALTTWLEDIVQHVEPWMSVEDIRSGTRWREVVATALDGTNFGIICVTADNQDSRWLNFEAGALAKHPDIARIVPLCMDLHPSDITGPLDAWQGLPFTEDGVRQLVHDVSAVTEKPMRTESLNRLFDRMWPDLESDVTEARAKTPQREKPRRPPDDMLEEIVDRLRRLERDRAPRRRTLRLAPGDTLSLAGGLSITVPDDPSVVRVIEELLTIRNDDLEVRLIPGQPRPGTVNAHASVGGAAVSTSSASGSLGGEPPEPGDLEEPPGQDGAE